MPLRKRSVLIVDEDAFLAGIYARQFERTRWLVRVAETAEEARKFVERRTPDAVLLDWETVEGGESLLHAWKADAKTARMARVLLTGLGTREALQRAKEGGADAYLLKGHFVPSEVCDKLARIVAARQNG